MKNTKTTITIFAAAVFFFISCQKEIQTDGTADAGKTRYLDESHPEKIWDLTATRPYEFIGKPLEPWVLEELRKDQENYHANNNNRTNFAAFEFSAVPFGSGWATQQSLFGHTWDAFDYGPKVIGGVNFATRFDLGQIVSYPSWNATTGFSTTAHTFGNIIATNPSITPTSLLLVDNAGVTGIGPDLDFGFNKSGNTFLRFETVIRDIYKTDNVVNYELLGNNIWNTFRLNFNGQYDKVWKDWTSFSLSSGSGWGGGIILDGNGAPSQVVLNAGHLMMKLGVNGDIQELKINYSGKVTEVYSILKVNAGLVTSVDVNGKLMTWQMDALGGVMGNIGTSSDKITVTLTGGYNRDNTTYFGTGGFILQHGPITGTGSVGYNTNLGVVIGANINIKF